MKVVLHYQEDSFLPYDTEAVEFAEKLPQNSIWVADFKQGRNPKFHSMAFAKLHEMYDMVDTELAFEPWRKALTIKAGYYTAIGKVDIKGVTSVAVVADSLNWENMEQVEFRDCFLLIHQAFVDKYGPKLTRSQIEHWVSMI